MVPLFYLMISFIRNGVPNERNLEMVPHPYIIIYLIEMGYHFEMKEKYLLTKKMSFVNCIGIL